MIMYRHVVAAIFFLSDVTLNKKAKQQVAETMMNENKKQEPSKDVHLQALKIFINLFPKGMIKQHQQQ